MGSLLHSVPKQKRGPGDHHWEESFKVLFVSLQEQNTEITSCLLQNVSPGDYIIEVHATQESPIIFIKKHFFFLLYHVACRILVPQPGTEPRALPVKALSPNHWTTREFCFFKKFYWSIVDLQCCVNFCCIAKWFSYTCTRIYISYFMFFSIMICHRILYPFEL